MHLPWQISLGLLAAAVSTAFPTSDSGSTELRDLSSFRLQRRGPPDSKRAETIANFKNNPGMAAKAQENWNRIRSMQGLGTQDLMTHLQEKEKASSSKLIHSKQPQRASSEKSSSSGSSSASASSSDGKALTPVQLYEQSKGPPKSPTSVKADVRAQGQNRRALTNVVRKYQGHDSPQQYASESESSTSEATFKPEDRRRTKQAIENADVKRGFAAEHERSRTERPSNYIEQVRISNGRADRHGHNAFKKPDPSRPSYHYNLGDQLRQQHQDHDELRRQEHQEEKVYQRPFQQQLRSAMNEDRRLGLPPTIHKDSPLPSPGPRNQGPDPKDVQRGYATMVSHNDQVRDPYARSRSMMSVDQEVQQRRQLLKQPHVVQAAENAATHRQNYEIAHKEAQQFEQARDANFRRAEEAEQEGNRDHADWFDSQGRYMRMQHQRADRTVQELTPPYLESRAEVQRHRGRIEESLGHVRHQDDAQNNAARQALNRLQQAGYQGLVSQEKRAVQALGAFGNPQVHRQDVQELRRSNPSQFTSDQPVPSVQQAGRAESPPSELEPESPPSRKSGDRESPERTLHHKQNRPYDTTQAVSDATSSASSSPRYPKTQQTARPLNAFFLQNQPWNQRNLRPSGNRMYDEVEDVRTRQGLRRQDSSSSFEGRDSPRFGRPDPPPRGGWGRRSGQTQGFSYGRPAQHAYDSRFDNAYRSTYRPQVRQHRPLSPASSEENSVAYAGNAHHSNYQPPSREENHFAFEDDYGPTTEGFYDGGGTGYQSNGATFY